MWLNISDAEGHSYWEVGARVTEGGMLSCFNLCQCPSVWRWWEFRAQCVPLCLAIDPADRSCRRLSKASAFYLSVRVCVRPYQWCGRPLSPYQSGPPRGEIGWAAPFALLFPANIERLSFCQCLYGVSLGVAWRTCFFFPFLPSP